MGVLLSRFRSKLSTKDVLEDIVKKLKSIDEFQQDTIESQKRIKRRLLVVTVFVYIIALLAFLLVSSIQKCKIYFFLGLLSFAVCSWIFHRSMQGYYNWRMVSNSTKSVKLRKKKKDILEDVMNTETYKVAKEILDVFGEKPSPPPLEVRGLQTPRQGGPGTELRQRQIDPKLIAARTNAPLPGQSTPSNVGKLPHQIQSVQRPTQLMHYGPAPLRPLPRPILPRERGFFDRLMDFCVGDGPHQRYALICRHCGGHNGMALQEEFEYVSYGCCYCYQFNPPRKQRPMGPRLPVAPPATANALTKNEEEDKESVKEGDVAPAKSESDSGDEAKSTESELDLSEPLEPMEPLDDTSDEKMDVDVAPVSSEEKAENDAETSSLR